MNIAVTTLATDNLPYKEEIFENRRQYCKKHGYTFFSHSSPLDNRPATWSKLKIILSIFEKQTFDWVLWTDSDSVILNEDIKIESLIDDNVDLIITKDCFSYNAGVFLIKNTEASKKFLQQWIEKSYYVGHPWQDQAALVEMLESESLDQRKSLKVKILPQRKMNSYPKQESREGWYTIVNEKKYFWDAAKSDEGEYKAGDFIIHYAGIAEEERSRLILSKLKKSNICVLSFATKDIAFYAERIFKNNKAYAEKHGYDWKEYWSVKDESRPPAWSKIKYIEETLSQGYDWVFWIDADAVIMNHSIDFAKFLDDNYDFILCKDAFSWNTGAWFIKNTPEALDLLKQTWEAEEYIDAFLWEQGAFMNKAYELGGRIKVHKQRDFNSIAKETKEFFVEGNEYECGTFKFVLNMKQYDKGIYEDGDFILHFASVNQQGRDMLLKIYRPDLYE